MDLDDSSQLGTQKLGKAAAFMRPIRRRLMLAGAVFFALFAWASVSLLVRQEHRQVIADAALAIVATQDRHADEVQEQLLPLATRARIICQTPAISGIARALANHGVDPLDGSSLAVWLARLEQICQAYVVNVPDLLQLRLIGVADGGCELVRIQRDLSGRATIVAPADLQWKGDQAYFTEAMRLPEDTIYFSPIELNQEQNQI